MPHHNSVFHQLQKHIPWSAFEALVDKHGADRGVRRLSCKSQLLALLFGQLAGASSLREIEAGLLSHSSQLYHLGGRCVARATLADANARRPAALFGELFAHMAAAAGRRTRRHMADAVRILDATRVRLSDLHGQWASPIAGVHAIKLHIGYDPDGHIPRDAAITGHRVNDITQAKTMTIEPGLTYVFDLGYYDYGWWAKLNAQGCRFVTRLKTNTPLELIEERHVSPQAPEIQASEILAERIGRLPRRLAHARNNPFADPVREIVVRLSTGKTIRLVSNDLEAPAAVIAELYKERWQIELFFKWIKQNLKIGHFLGTSENAVRIQLFVALIAYLLLRAAHQTQRAIPKPLTFRRLVRLNLMHKRPINALNAPPTQTQPTNQMTLNLT